jgi:hypothetical protein
MISPARKSSAFQNSRSPDLDLSEAKASMHHESPSRTRPHPGKCSPLPSPRNSGPDETAARIRAQQEMLRHPSQHHTLFDVTTSDVLSESHTSHLSMSKFKSSTQAIFGTGQAGSLEYSQQNELHLMFGLPAGVARTICALVLITTLALWAIVSNTELLMSTPDALAYSDLNDRVITEVSRQVTIFAPSLGHLHMPMSSTCIPVQHAKHRPFHPARGSAGADHERAAGPGTPAGDGAAVGAEAAGAGRRRRRLRWLAPGGRAHAEGAPGAPCTYSHVLTHQHTHTNIMRHTTLNSRACARMH